MSMFLRKICFVLFFAVSLCGVAQNDNLPFFDSGPIRYGIKSSSLRDYAIVQKLLEPGLTTVSIPYNVSRGICNYYVEEIGSQAFSYSALQSIELSEGIHFIESSAFEGSKLKRFECPPHLRLIGDAAFRWCTDLEEIVTDANLKEVGVGAFRGCLKLTRFDCPPDMHTIGEMAFYSCDALKTVTFGKDMINIGSMAFDACWNIKLVVCGNPTPATLDNAFTRDVYDNALLVVPRGSLEAYKSAAGWKEFLNVAQDRNKGDTNGDETINSSDVVMVFNHISTGGDVVSAYFSDVDGDGSVSSSDVVVLYNIIINGND